ncbi:MAG: rhamnulokinase family protein [Candidatus Omnitrophota bacterium]
MKGTKKFLAFDIGASNGRAMAGFFDGEKIIPEDIHRFVNEPVFVNESLHWDVLRIFSEMKTGLCLFSKKYGRELDGIGIDTWGVDFGLLDKDGKLLSNPYHYRDNRTAGLAEEIKGMIDGYDIYRTTGAQITSISTLCQLYAMAKQKSPQLKIAKTLLLMPSLLNYFLNGKIYAEYSSITPTGLFDIVRNKPAYKFFRRLGIPPNLIPKVVRPGTIIGSLEKVPIIAPATHDTASAVISVPADSDKEWAFLSCGTWSVLGFESGRPVTTPEAYGQGIINVATAEGKFATVANITGLWLLQECKRIWENNGTFLKYPEMVELAKKARPFSALIDVDHRTFVRPDNMPNAIADFCRRTDQQPPSDKDALIRVVLESLALKYKEAKDKLERFRGKKFEVLHLVGGGAHNILLCQFTANALGIPVLAGPFEATSLGNILAQMVGAKAISSISEGRRILRNSIKVSLYQPRDTEKWTAEYYRYQKIISRKII